ncbi:hypothetical protein AC1031_010007 [Aphanomyces cochlioides]|nr:hypothetical protein AC1031_010007 [Aphanomyces cochlioides]
MDRELWEAIRDVDPIQATVDNWNEFFRSIMTNEATRTPFGDDLLQALKEHCEAMNLLDTGACNSYKEIVNSPFSPTVLHTVADTEDVMERPLATHPTGFQKYNAATIAGAVCAMFSPADASRRVRACFADKIRETPSFIEERTSDNAIAQTASSMAKLLEVMKRKLGDEKLNSAYMMLMGALSQHNTESDTMRFDVHQLTTATVMLRRVINAPEFRDLLRLVRIASLSALDCADLVQQFGSEIKTSILSIFCVVIDNTAKGMSFLAMTVGCMLYRHVENIEIGIDVMIDVMAMLRKLVRATRRKLSRRFGSF